MSNQWGIILALCAIILFAILLAGCANIATGVALVNVMAAERSIEPPKPKKLRVTPTHAAREPTSGATRGEPHGRCATERRTPSEFQNRFGRWNKTKLDLWGPDR